ncbi:MAG TPA: hypothetical protein VHK86_01735, partial [Nitrososphaera sp.]|nr:hypothetical protein [Nitrososphaera sp.]
MKKTLILMLLACMLVAACAPKEAPAPATPEPTAAQPTPKPAEPVPEAKPDTRIVNDDISKIMQKADSVKSFSFTVAKLPDRSSSDTYYVKGTKIRIDPVRKLYRDMDIDVVYLDTVAKTATGYCLPTKGCTAKNVARSLNYDDWIVPLPPQWMDQAKYGKTAGSLTFYSRPVTKVKYQVDGKYYEAYIDNYYGFPL